MRRLFRARKQEVGGLQSPHRAPFVQPVLALDSQAGGEDGVLHRHESEGEEDAVLTATLTLLVTADGELSVQSTGVFRTEVVLEAGRWQFREFRLALDRPF